MKSNIRKELYNFIVEHNLQEEVKKTFNKNYTQVGNSDLSMFVEKHKNTTSSTFTTQSEDNKSKVDRLIEVLAAKRILLKSELNYICG